MPDVIVVGAGPVGMLLAGLLRQSGVDAQLLERRDAPGAGTRAIGIHAPVLAALEPSGITDELLDSALRVPRGEARAGDAALGVVRFDRLSTRFPFVATLPQSATERVLAAHAPSAERAARVAAVRPGDRAVEVIADDGTSRTASLVVVAGGWTARPLVYRPDRVAVTTYPDRYLMADVAVGERADAATAVVNLAPGGVLESFPLPDGMRRVVAWDGMPESADGTVAGTDADADRSERLRQALRTRGEPAVAETVTTATAFGVRRVLAPALRRGRLLVVGDTAHEVSPLGGQGMNLGLLDAVTLAPLLVRWVRSGDAPEADLARWERRRLRSAATAGRLAAVNTVLGRARGPLTHAARGILVRAMLAGVAGRAFASAYAMGLDADA